ncbi:MAG: lytic transglycosylase domain-containing protein [Stellaceae bacterium]
MIAGVTAACIAAAAATFQVSEPALKLVMRTEGGRIGVCTTQKTGVHDCGPAQINAEIWTPYFAQLLKRPIPEIFYAIRDNGCFNVNAAAYILRLKIQRADGNVWDGMGRYNSATPAIKHAYQKRLLDTYLTLTKSKNREATASR